MINITEATIAKMRLIIAIIPSIVFGYGLVNVVRIVMNANISSRTPMSKVPVLRSKQQQLFRMQGILKQF